MKNQKRKVVQMMMTVTLDYKAEQLTSLELETESEAEYHQPYNTK